VADKENAILPKLVLVVLSLFVFAIAYQDFTRFDESYKEQIHSLGQTEELDSIQEQVYEDEVAKIDEILEKTGDSSYISDFPNIRNSVADSTDERSTSLKITQADERRASLKVTRDDNLGIGTEILAQARQDEMRALAKNDSARLNSKVEVLTELRKKEKAEVKPEIDFKDQLATNLRSMGQFASAKVEDLRHFKFKPDGYISKIRHFIRNKRQAKLASRDAGSVREKNNDIQSGLKSDSDQENFRKNSLAQPNLARKSEFEKQKLAQNDSELEISERRAKILKLSEAETLKLSEVQLAEKLKDIKSNSAVSNRQASARSVSRLPDNLNLIDSSSLNGYDLMSAKDYQTRSQFYNLDFSEYQLILQERARLANRQKAYYEKKISARNVPKVSRNQSDPAEPNKPVTLSAKNDDYINILFLGVDSVVPRNFKSWYGRSDFMLLMSYRRADHKLFFLSIPRDTHLDRDKYPVSRVNAANAKGGPKLAKKVIKQLTGFKVDHYVLINMAGFKDVVDEFAPYKIYVARKMKYDDFKADLHIDFEPGLHEMYAEDLIKFLRFRDKRDGDIGRIKRQHMFFRSFARNLKIHELIEKMPRLMNLAGKMFLTDMNYAESINYIRQIYPVINRGFDSYILPGDFGRQGYWIIDYPKLNKLLAQMKKKK
jgi:LCP family protein required for cell wall assembly